MKASLRMFWHLLTSEKNAVPLPLLGWRVRLIWITAAALLLVLGIARPLGVMLIIAGVCFFLAVRCLMLERQFKEEAQKQDGAAEEELEI